MINSILVMLMNKELYSNKVCSNCGNCCYIVDMVSGVQTNIPCPYLIIDKSTGLSRCKVYFRNRVGRLITHGNKCSLRKDVKYNYPGCSMNVDGQAFIESVRSNE